MPKPCGQNHEGIVQNVTTDFLLFSIFFSIQGSDYYPKSFPKLPPEVLQNGNLQKQVLELASMLDVRSLFYDIGDAPPAD